MPHKDIRLTEASNVEAMRIGHLQVFVQTSIANG